MASDSEEEVLDDAAAICGWGAADFDDELLDRGHRKAPVKVATKRKPQKSFASSKSGILLANEPLAPSSPVKQVGETTISPVRKVQVVEAPTERKIGRKQREKVRESHAISGPKPPPRTLPLREEHVTIAALGRERRMKIVVAAMAVNVPRKSSLGSVVSAAFDADSDDEQEETEAMRRRRIEDWVPSSAPEKQQLEKLPLMKEPSTAPAGPIEAVKMIHPPLPLPLLSIKPDCGGNETRLVCKNAPPSEVPCHWRRRRRKQSSLLPSRDVSDNWESNFPPALRRSTKHQAGLPSSDTSSFTRVVRVPPALRQENPSSRTVEDHLPLIHLNSKDFKPASDVLAHAAKGLESVVALSDDQVQSGEKDDDDDDDESWARCYDDPEVLANSMAGLIHALSAFAAGGKHAKSSSVWKNKKRRAKQELQQRQLVSSTVVEHPQPGDIAARSRTKWQESKTSLQQTE